MWGSPGVEVIENILSSISNVITGRKISMNQGISRLTGNTFADRLITDE
jgi:hypothetical protein